MQLNILLAQAEAITSSGSISANWVLVGVTTIATILIWRMLNKIESNLEKVIGKVGNHQTKLELHDMQLEGLEEDVLELKKEIKLRAR